MRKVLSIVVSTFFFFLTYSIVYSQECEFSCVDHVYLGLDEDCEYYVSITDVVKDTTGCSGAEVKLFDHYGVEIFNPLSGPHRGQKITYKVIDPSNSNSCWGHLTVEDKWASIIECTDDTLNCWDAEEFINATPEDDNCGYGLQFEELHRIWVDYNCDSVDFIGYVERSVVSTDVWGNTSRCDSQRIYIIREYLDSLVCPQDTFFECCINKYNPDPTSIGDLFICLLWDPDYAYEDEDGYSHPIPKPGGLVEPPYIKTPDGDRHYVGTYVNAEGGVNNGKCNIIGEYKDHIVPTCGPTYKIRREWKIFDWCTGEDTICVQWIKIIDNEPPVVFFGPEFTPIIVAYTQPHECVAHVELGWPTIYADCAIKAAKGDHEKAFKDFKVKYEMEWYDQDHPGKINVRTGEIPYGEKVVEYVPKSGILFIQPEIKVKYTVTDGCWNESRVCQTILVFDNEAPTPVCDEITQVTLDPDSCWVRIYAEDLDDGSHDNCDEVHFAVAKMSDIEYWRDYWHDALHECYYEYHYATHIIDHIIEEWIDLYVFESYIDLEECGTDSLVLRVYEDLYTPPYDPHKFRGSEHDWYNWYRAPLLRLSSYRCNYVYYYDSLGHYNDPIYPEILCADIEIALVLELIENTVVDVLAALNEFDFQTISDIFDADLTIDINEVISQLLSVTCENPFIDEDDQEDELEEITCFELSSIFDDLDISGSIDTSAQGVAGVLLALLQGDLTIITDPNIILQNPGLLQSDMTVFAPITTAQSFGGPLEILEFINILYYLICYGADIDMKTQVFENLVNNPELLAFVIEEKNLIHPAFSGIWRKRFLDLPYYNDCMIEVIKDDKTPPVCMAPDPAYYYCDGVPVEGSIFPNGGNDEVYWTSARFAHDICRDGDIWLSGCEFDRTDDEDSKYAAPDDSPWCVDAPWDGGDHGYYGGPSGDHYYYDDPCDEGLLAWYPEDDYTWKPIYCRFWLMLDKYDTEGDGKPNPYDYFGEPEYYDNCWEPDITEETHGELDECGVGILTRTWTVTDKCGNTSSCYQTITIKARSDFEVKFPADVEVACTELQGIVTLPFEVQYTGTYNFTGPNPDRCEGAINVIVDGEGQGTVVGTSTIHFDFCGIPDTTTGIFAYGDPYPGDGYIVADNGDTLFITVSGEVLPGRLNDHPEFVTSYWRDPFEIIGGTGRFEGATGGGVSDDYNSSEDPNSHHNWSGTITLVGQNMEGEGISSIGGEPEISDDDCELIGITYSDQVIDTEQDGCYKILRTWKVIDWCVYSPDIHGRYPDVIVDDRCVADTVNRPCVIRNLKDDGDGFMTYLQVIKVVDDFAPDVVCNPDTSFCIWDEECADLYVEYVLGSATDICTEELQYRYAVNPYGESPEEDWIFGHGYKLQNTLPPGEHTVRLYARDDCGNESYCELNIEIKDCKLPTPYCYDAIATVIMPSTGEITIWASDYDAGSFDNCTPKDSLLFSFTDVEYAPSKTFDCGDIPNGEMLRIPLDIWVKDQAGNQDFCRVEIVLQDGSGQACGDISSSLVNEQSATTMKTKTGKVKRTNNLVAPSENGKATETEILLKQNRPNPYKESTIIEFELLETQNLTLRVLDLGGRTILEQSGSYPSGLNQWNIRKEKLQVSSGILYYQLIAEGQIYTKKMVLIE